MSPKTLHDHVLRRHPLVVERFEVGHGRTLTVWHCGIQMVGRRGGQRLMEQLLISACGSGFIGNIGHQEPADLSNWSSGSPRAEEGVGEQAGRLGKALPQAGGGAGEREPPGVESEHAAEPSRSTRRLPPAGAILDCLVSIAASTSRAGQLRTVRRSTSTQTPMFTSGKWVRGGPALARRCPAASGGPRPPTMST